MSALLKKTGRKLTRMFEAESPLDEMRDLPPSIEDMQQLVQRHRLSDLLPYETYDPDQQVYWNEDSIGVLIRATPTTGMNETTLNVLAGIFTQGLKPGTTLQFSMYASPDIEPILDHWAGARQGEIFRFLANKRTDYLRRGAWQPLFESEPQMLRDFQLLISVEIPKEPDLQPDGPEVEGLRRIRDSMLGSISSAGIPCEPCTPDQFLQQMDVLLNPSETPRDPIRWDPEGDVLARQMTSWETAIWTGRDSLGLSCNGFEVELRPMSVRQYPRSWAGWSMSNMIGDLYSSLLRVPCPFLYTLTIEITDPISMASKAKFKSTRATQMADSPVGRFVPAWADRKKEWQFVVGLQEDGHRMVRMHWQSVLFPRPSDADFAEQRFKAVFEARGWRMQRDRFIALPAFLSALPMTAGPRRLQELASVGRCRKGLSWTAVNTAPMIAEWKGTGSPLLMLIGRRGQIQMVDNFDNKKGNYNIAVAAASGAGKSFFVQEMTTSTLGTGGRCWAIDSGRSYENLCKMLKGDFLQFSPETRICLNPFTYVKNMEESLPMLIQLLAEMSTANNLGLNALQLSFLQQAITASWNDYGPDSTITTVARWLHSHESSAAKIIGQMLHSYTAEGAYARFFEGASNIDLSNPYVVLELGELDGKRDLRGVVLMLLIASITEVMYLSDRNQRKLCIIDEAWKLMSGGNTGHFIEEGYRTARKFGGAFCTITQGIDDYYKSPTSEAALANSDWLFLLRQKPESLQAAAKNDRLAVDAGLEALLKSLDTQHGLFSEIAVIGPGGTSVGRLIVDAFSEKLYSTQAREYQAIRDMENQGVSLIEAIERLAQASGRI